MKRVDGLVLTWNVIVSPARALVREQNPSMFGQRYFVAGSTRVFVSSHSRVPGRWFSVTIELDGSSARPIRQLRAAAPRPTTCFNASRRESLGMILVAQ